MLRAAPSILCTSRYVIRPVARRQFGSEAQKLPGFVQTFFQYASDAYATQGIEAGMGLIHSMDVPWVASFVAAGFLLRVLTSPMHIMAEKLFAKRLHLNNYLTMQMFEKVSKRHGIPIVPDPKTNEPKFAHPNKDLNVRAHNLVKSAITNYFNENRLQYSRIMIMKTCTIPIWIYSAFAVRNILTRDFGVSLPGVLWLDSFLAPDPYFILPAISVSIGFLNFFSQRILFPTKNQKTNFKIYDGLVGFSLLVGGVIMAQMPACVSLYWLSIGMTGIAQSLLLRHPKVKELLGIKRLPTDSKTPLRDLFFLRRRQLM
ncbi:hypothetical protein M3Y97_00670700 [Aphelenchoides bicaudatus]|nr:hypothetical protein M3Y97_00670700 [Aphelenchoides bicaudatus]